MNPESKEINRSIISLSLPAIATNITVPLLGLCDTAISGHLGNAIFIAAIAAGSTMLNVILWLCSFLRMGTSGLTAEAYGAKDLVRQTSILVRSVGTALTIGLLILLFKNTISDILLTVIDPSDETKALSTEYFHICAMGVPPLLCVLSINGWFIGMQNTVQPMIISITMNIINIAASFFCVFFADMGFRGVATGTLAANWITLILAILILIRFIKKRDIKFTKESFTSSKGGAKFVKTNINLFLRSFCIMGVSLAITATGARISDLTLAANALLMQFFILFSYFTDGFAYSAEALVGKFYGAKSRIGMKTTIRLLSAWGLSLVVIFTIIYLVFQEPILHILTDNIDVIEYCGSFAIYIILIPVVSAAAFILDGVYIGLGRTRRMLVTTAIGTFIFALILWMFIYSENALKSSSDTSNSFLWIAFLSYLFIRSIGLAVQLPRLIVKE